MFNVVKKDLASIPVKVTFTKNTDTQEVWSGPKTLVGIVTESEREEYEGITAILQFAENDPTMDQLKQGFAEAFAAALADGDNRPFVSVSGLVIPAVKPAVGKNPSTDMVTNNILVSISSCKWDEPEIFIDEAPLALVGFEEAAETTLQNTRQAVLANKEARNAALLEQRSIQAATQGAKAKTKKAK